MPLDALATGRATPVEIPDAPDCDGLTVSEDGSEVAASCLTSDGTSTMFTSGDGEDWSRATEAIASPMHTFAVDDGWVVYARWDSAPPALVAVPPGEPDAAFEVATIDKGCLECGAYWPPNYVELEGGRVAWNYAQDGEAEPVFTKVGMARICPGASDTGR